MTEREMAEALYIQAHTSPLFYAAIASEVDNEGRSKVVKNTAISAIHSARIFTVVAQEMGVASDDDDFWKDK